MLRFRAMARARRGSLAAAADAASCGTAAVGLPMAPATVFGDICRGLMPGTGRLPWAGSVLEAPSADRRLDAVCRPACDVACCATATAAALKLRPCDLQTPPTAVA